MKMSIYRQISHLFIGILLLKQATSQCLSGSMVIPTEVLVNVGLEKLFTYLLPNITLSNQDVIAQDMNNYEVQSYRYNWVKFVQVIMSIQLNNLPPQLQILTTQNYITGEIKKYYPTIQTGCFVITMDYPAHYYLAANDTSPVLILSLSPVSTMMVSFNVTTMNK
jgi:hypothetical protein